MGQFANRFFVLKTIVFCCPSNAVWHVNISFQDIFDYLLLTKVFFCHYTVQAWYKGCYVDKPDDRVFIISAGNYDPTDSSPQECTYKCAVLNFTYAATQGDVCFCANDYSKNSAATNESLCSSDCTDIEKCGDKSYIKVYETVDSIDGLNITLPEKEGTALSSVSFGTTLEKGAILIFIYILNQSIWAV